MNNYINWTEYKIHEVLVKGCQGDRDDAIAALDALAPKLDRPLLVKLLLHSIEGEFSSAHDSINPNASAARDWLLSALARFSGEIPGARKVALDHLDPKTEPKPWVRYWTLAALLKAAPTDLSAIARERVKDPDKLIQLLAQAILAAKEDEPHALKAVQQGLRKQDANGLREPDWHTLRALRIVFIPGLAEDLAQIVSSTAFSDTVYDAVVALARIPSDHPDARIGAEALHKRLTDWRKYYMWNTMRVQGLKTLGLLKQPGSIQPLMEDILDENPGIAREAARSLGKILGVPKATNAIVTFGKTVPNDLLPRVAASLRFLEDRSSVLLSLKEIMIRDTDERAGTAEALLKEIGGAEALQMLRSHTESMDKHLKRLEEEEKDMLEHFQKLTDSARSGFGVMKWMDVTVFIVGILLLLASAGLTLFRDGTLNSWAGVTGTGVMAGCGVLGVLVGTLVEGPRKRLRQAIDHLMGINVVFLGYLRQLRQVDQSFRRQFIESVNMSPTDITLYQKMIQNAMTGAGQSLQPDQRSVPVGPKPTQALQHVPKENQGDPPK